MTQPRKIVILLGPTAVGKTAMALKLCKQFNGEMISADSQQVYRGMDIGTAKENLTGYGVKCHLIDIINPDEHFDASLFKTLADAAIEDVVKRGVVPVVVGGTGFYIKTLLFGLSKAPSRDMVMRRELMQIREKNGAEAIHRILQGEDPVMALKLAPADFVRAIRAIEVKRLTGKSLADFNKEHESQESYNALKVGLTIDRKELYEKINARVDLMFEGGLIDEVRGLVDKYGSDMQSLKAVGYKEVVSFIKGEVDIDGARRLTKQNTRHFAKRQMTFFRADKKIVWFDPRDFENIASSVENFLGG